MHSKPKKEPYLKKLNRILIQKFYRWWKITKRKISWNVWCMKQPNMAGAIFGFVNSYRFFSGLCKETSPWKKPHSKNWWSLNHHNFTAVSIVVTCPRSTKNWDSGGKWGWKPLFTQPLGPIGHPVFVDKNWSKSGTKKISAKTFVINFFQEKLNDPKEKRTLVKGKKTQFRENQPSVPPVKIHPNSPNVSGFTKTASLIMKTTSFPSRRWRETVPLVGLVSYGGWTPRLIWKKKSC